MSKNIETLVNMYGISGFENQVKKHIQSQLKNLPQFEDGLGGFAGVIDSGVPGNNILVLAHMDEVGFMLKQITENGICKVTSIGSFVPQSIINSRVVAITADGTEYEGVILGQSPHGNDGKGEFVIEKFNVDFGFTSNDQALSLGFELGMQIALKADFAILQNNRAVSKAFDNRLGCAAVIDLMDKLKGNLKQGKVYLGLSVQEEVGLRGASPLINSLPDQIDYALIIDVSPVEDLEKVTNGTLGGGTLIRVQDPRTVLTVSEVQHLRTLGKENGIKNQDFFSKGGTDASAIQISGSGVKTCALCVPGRNLHTQNSVIAIDDYNATVELAYKYIESRTVNE